MKPPITLPNELDPMTRTYDPDDLTREVPPEQPNTPESRAAADQREAPTGAHRSGDLPSFEHDIF